MIRSRSKGFSLVEVAIAASVLGVAAVMLSAALSVSNAQKATSRRLGLARSLAVRQLELIQQRINETTVVPAPFSVSTGANAVLKLATLRGASSVSMTQSGAPHFFCYTQSPATTLNAGGGQLVGNTSHFHVLKVSTGAAGEPPGMMTQAERDRVGNESLDVQLFAAACTMDGHTDETPNPPVALPAVLQQLDLILFQVVVLDKLNNAAGIQILTLSRMYRVQSDPPFGGEGQF